MRVFSIRTLVATKFQDSNKALLQREILPYAIQSFLTTTPHFLKRTAENVGGGEPNAGQLRDRTGDR